MASSTDERERWVITVEVDKVDLSEQAAALLANAIAAQATVTVQGQGYRIGTNIDPHVLARKQISVLDPRPWTTNPYPNHKDLHGNKV